MGSKVSVRAVVRVRVVMVVMVRVVRLRVVTCMNQG